MTTTIEDGFGSRLMTDGRLPAQQRAHRLLVPSGRRRQAGGESRRARQAAALVDGADDRLRRAGRVHLVTGSPGGSSIINYVAKTLVGVIDWKLDPQAAVALPNFGSRNGPTELERGTPIDALADQARALGHDVAVIELTSGAQAIVRTRDRMDRRRRSAARRHGAR